MAIWVSNEPSRSEKLIYQIQKCWTETYFYKIPKNWKTKFSFSEFLCILKLPWAMRTFALERNFLHFSTLLYARTNISYANFYCSKFCQMRYPNIYQHVSSSRSESVTHFLRLFVRWFFRVLFWLFVFVKKKVSLQCS